MKNNSKYTKNKEKWLDIYVFCKIKLYQVNKRIISIISKKLDKANNINISVITKILRQVNKRIISLIFKKLHQVYKKFKSYASKNKKESRILSPKIFTNLTINLIATQQLIETANGIDFTFHRAFDCVKDPLVALENLIALKIKRVLSSGLKPSAVEGISLLSEMNKIANQQIEIMPGSGINLDNVLQFKNKGFTSIHLSATQQPEKKSASYFEGGTEGVSNEKIIRKISI